MEKNSFEKLSHSEKVVLENLKGSWSVGKVYLKISTQAA